MERSRIQPWVAFDFGEVLSRPPTHLAELAGLLGRPEPAVTAAYRRHRAGYDLGASGAEYWAAVGAEVGVAVDQALTEQLIEAESRDRMRLHRESEPLLREVKAAGHGLVLVSNLPRPLAERVKAQAWSALFDELVFSCDVGVMKPDAAIYRLTAERIAAHGATPPCVFFDDRPENVAAADAAGWRAHVWAGHDDARSFLAEAVRPIGEMANLVSVPIPRRSPGPGAVE